MLRSHTMVHVHMNVFLYVCLTLTGLTVTPALRILNSQLQCNEQGLECSSKIYNCSDIRMTVPRDQAPPGPEWRLHDLHVGMEGSQPVPVMNVTWMLAPNSGLSNINGSEIKILEEATGTHVCVQYFFLKKINKLKPGFSKWTLFLDGVIVKPGHKYLVSIFNLPEPEVGDYTITRPITIPGCEDHRIQEAQVCLENGSLWDPNISEAVSVNKQHSMMVITVHFESAQFSEVYNVSIHGPGLYYANNISKENNTSLNVTFNLALWQLTQCEMFIVIQPFFVRCMNSCLHHNKTFNYCSHYSKPPPRSLMVKATLILVILVGLLAITLRGTAKKALGHIMSPDVDGQPECAEAQRRRRVLILYSLDHPLYKNVIIKLSAFLMAKCGTEVVLDLLDSTRLGEMGRIQWLDWHREQIMKSSDKIIILCSRGVQAKWRAMCGGNCVVLRGDQYSPTGDMLSVALSLIVPHFVGCASFQKYIVAYFDKVCSEEDVPSPFNITVRYRLMKDFEELFFRILDIEKHRPGRVQRARGLAEDEYFHCATGRALRDALEQFHAYQLEHPEWFDDELCQDSGVEIPETIKTQWEKDSLCHYESESTSQPDSGVLSVNLSVPEQLPAPHFESVQLHHSH